jgi:hypothetical protein
MTSKNLQVFKVLDTDKKFPQKPGLLAIAADSDNQTITNQSRSFIDPNTYRQKQIRTNFKSSHTVSSPMVTDNLTLDEKRRIQNSGSRKNKEADRNIPLFEGKTVILLDKFNCNWENLNHQSNQKFTNEQILRKLVEKTTKLHQIYGDMIN